MSRTLVSIEPAIVEDAEEIALVLRRSIKELCALDHGNDPLKLDPWLSNKTAEAVRRWIDGPGHLVSAVEKDAGTRRIVGVGMVSTAGEVQLNYVLPDRRLSGVSKAVMHALETHLRELGHARAHLTSSVTAEKFYRSIGYTEVGETRSHRGMPVRTFEKQLVAE